MRLFYTDVFVLPLPPGHRFPMEKYSRLRAALLASGEFAESDFHLPPPASDTELARAHTPDYIAAVASGRLDEKAQKAIGFPWSPGMVERSRRSAGATLSACRAALEDGVAANLAGGTHHAFADHGEGFCVFNDAAVAALAMRAEGRARRILIVDCDVHQGNGTASILAGHEDIFTFSIHGARNYPFTKEQSDLDIELPDGCTDEAYLLQLEAGLETAFDLARPDLVIYLAGADPYHDDRLGRLSLSFAGLAERDRRVFAHCRSRHLPLAIAMAGGYARQIDDTVRIHATTLHLARANQR
ncbi:histone deacetylase family protein [Quatrionicoccus australiensis]|uniref:histone deacetylase family protein n=1 Tax=Quatrionicoccus australiensis TaxID=138118 RepID=UPI001CFC181B|nr:histone deacetylase [Quatrionicoccus australiensis]MCB4361949.1 histone deacetylase [Quatrionicoccus australiensis]